MQVTKTLFSAEEIEQKVRDLAKEISMDYQSIHGDLILISLLKGSFVFTADLIRALKIPVHVEFMSVSSYGSATVSSRDVRIQQDIDCSISGRHVLLVEDIVDTGHTFAKVLGLLSHRQPASLKSVTLLDKPSRRVVQVPVDYIGFTIPDVFVCGYGLDYDQQYRQLPFIGILSEDENPTYKSN